MFSDYRVKNVHPAHHDFFTCSKSQAGKRTSYLRHKTSAAPAGQTSSQPGPKPHSCSLKRPPVAHRPPACLLYRRKKRICKRSEALLDSHKVELTWSIFLRGSATLCWIKRADVLSLLPLKCILGIRRASILFSLPHASISARLTSSLLGHLS